MSSVGQQSVSAAIQRCNAGRKPDLLAVKGSRMADNVFACFRGTDHLFAWRWPQFAPADPGPTALICGDLHW